jgi:beta-lactam-binding protein with PASTA domain
VAARLIVFLAATVVAAGCATTAARRVPDLKGQTLDVAENRLDLLGLRYETLGGGAFGVVVRSHWTVCTQSPRAGATAATVTLFVARNCPGPFVPDVTDRSLEDAEEILGDAGIPYAVETGGDRVLIASLWTICSQIPAPGERGSRVELYASHNCW